MNHPLQPLKPFQRLAWLRHSTEITCRRSYLNGSLRFQAGQRYLVTVETVKVRSHDRRRRPDGISEPIVFSGQNILVRIKDAGAYWHRFLENPAADHPEIHDLDFLVRYFTIPDVKDVAQLNPKQFAANKRALRKLET